MITTQSKLILGTVQMGLPYGINNSAGKIQYAESHEILREAFQSGLRTLDTAEVYGDAHQVIGDFHRSNPDLIFEVITKIPSNESTNDLERKIKKYLVDLHVTRLQGLMFHSFQSYKKHRDFIPELLYLKKLGLFRQLGVSIYTNVELKDLIEDDTIDLVQLPFNLLDNLSFRGDLIKEAKSRNKTVHTRSTFLQGLFFKDPTEAHTIVQQLGLELVKIHQIASDKKISINQLALGYCLQQDHIDKVLIGVDSIEQLRTNLVSNRAGIDELTMDKINHIQTTNTTLLNPSSWSTNEPAWNKN